jgi:uncharacterized protein YfdQ (DUF2303 family)
MKQEDQYLLVNNASDAFLAADLARRADATLCTPRKAEYRDAAPFIVLRDINGSEFVVWLKERMEEPHRKAGTVKLNDAKSFIAYYATHGNGMPVYATLEPARFLAVLNENTKDKAGWRDHRADFTVRHSREWTVWAKHNGSGAAFNSNEAFALFLEENAPDIVKPEPATMLAIALNFRVKADVQFSLAQRLEDGNVELGYSNVVQGSAPNPTGGKSLKIPEQFTIEVPVWDGIDARRYRVDARFRYRLAGGRVTLWYDLVRPHKVVETAFKDLWAEIEKGTKAPILHGCPE